MVVNPDDDLYPSSDLISLCIDWFQADLYEVVGVNWVSMIELLPI